MKRALTSLIVLMAIGIGQAHAHAAQATSGVKGITISPYLQQVNIGAGPSTTPVRYSVTNNTNDPQTLHISSVDFGSLNETGGVAFLGGSPTDFEGRHGLSAWMSIAEPDVVIAPHQTLDAEANIKDDGSLAPGGHYGAILISTLPGTQSAVRLNQTVTALILAVKQGGIKYDLKLARLSTNGSIFHPPALATLRFYNPGNVHEVPRGIVRLYAGQRLASQGIINTDSDFVLPGSYRLIYVPLTKVHGSGVHIIYSYKLKAYYRYDGYDKFALKTYTVRWINWPLALLLLLILASVGWVIKRGFDPRRLVRPSWRLIKKTSPRILSLSVRLARIAPRLLLKVLIYLDYLGGVALLKWDKRRAKNNRRK